MEVSERKVLHSVELFYGLLNKKEKKPITTLKELLDYQRQLSNLYCCHFGIFDTTWFTQTLNVKVEKMPSLTFNQAVELHEIYCNQQFVEGKWVKFRSPTGVFYTPKFGVQHVIESLGKKIKKAETIIDPTMGCGRFVLGIFKFLCEFFEPLQALDRLYGVDTDPVAVSLVRWWFCRKVGAEVAEKVSSRFLCGNGLTGILRFKTFCRRFPEDAKRFLTGDPVETTMPLDAICWFSDFPEIANRGGFDLVIGNPPWHILNNEDLKFIGWDEFKVNKKKGKKDLWKLFVERGSQMTRKGGILAFLVPWGFTSLQSCLELREYLVQKGNIFLIDQFGISQMFSDIQKGTVLFAWKRGEEQKEVMWLNKGRVKKNLIVPFQRQRVTIDAIFPQKQTGLTIQDVFKLRRGIQDTKRAICLPWDRNTPIANSHFDDPQMVRERFNVEPVAFHCTQAITPFLIRRSFCQRSKKHWQYGGKSRRRGEFKLRWCPPDILPNASEYGTVAVKSLMGPMTKRRLVAAPCESNEYGAESVIFIRIPLAAYSKWFVLGLLNSQYLEDFIRRDNPTTTNLRIGRIPFKHIDHQHELYKTICKCAKKIHQLQLFNQQEIDQQEREILEVDDLEEVLPSDRLEKFAEPEPVNQEILKRLNEAVEAYYSL